MSSIALPKQSSTFSVTALCYWNTFDIRATPVTMATIVDELKGLIPDPSMRIRLDDVVAGQIRAALAATSLANFPVQGAAQPTQESLAERLKSFETAISEIQSSAILLARWADVDGLLLLQKILSRIADTDKGTAGLTLWIRLGWYPLQLLMYSAGIAAISAGRFDSLKAILMADAQQRDESRGPVLIPVSANMAEASDSWKLLPGYERRHTPKSDYLFELLQSRLDEMLLLGASYERLFDDFEIFLALTYAHATGRDWGPIGRFGWKRDHDQLFSRMIEQAQREKSAWPPLRAGLFNGSAEEFCVVAEALRKRINSIGWW